MFFTHADYLNPQRQELINWFSRNAPGLGKLYEGALYMVYTNGFPGRVRFVAHAVREIRNRLPDVIAGPISKKRLDYKSRLDQLTDEWKRSGFPIDGSLPMDIDEEGKISHNTGVFIPVHLYKEIASLVRDHNESRETPREKARRLFLSIDPNNKKLENTLVPRVKHWLNVTEWFVNRVHNWQLDDEIEAKELQQRFEIFEAALISLIRDFFETTEELDEILEEANS